MRRAGADWEMVYFGNAVHGFTNPANKGDWNKGVAYNPHAAVRAWKCMRYFLGDCFTITSR